ncbi:hypothetical protein PybrP1_004756 [[Pythium] brassicae (nom. inval.)]|nr:hypothetical protein PybrP1_004756 [[Pythium] brassicae (nom. inval.)]
MARSSPPASARTRSSTSSATPPRSASGHRIRTFSASPGLTVGPGSGGGSGSDTVALDAEAQRVVAQLECVSLELAVAVRHEDDVRYVLTVRHARAHALWRHRRSFDEYRALQERLLRALHHGHFCGGECPLLETFLVSYFPATTRFRLGFLLERRRAALFHLLQTVRSFLLERRNLACAVAKTHVAREFLGFVYGDLLAERDSRGGGALDALDAAALRSGLSAKAPAKDSDNANDNDGDGDGDGDGDDGESRRSFAEVALSPAGGVTDADTCTLCALPMPATNVYVTQLRCGHRFHDECALPRLNESLRCPTCGTLDS